MPNAALVATQLTDRTSRIYTLTVGGFDVNVTGVGPSLFRVPIDSIHIDEQGPGGVSSMDFTIWDTSAGLSPPSQAALVQFHDVTNNLALFAGFVQSTSVSTRSIDRWIKVRCVGVEVLLDWMIIPSLTIPAGTKIFDAVQSAYANASGVGVPLRALHEVDNGEGNQAIPIGGIGFVSGDLVSPTTNIALTFAGETLREAIRMISDAAPNNQLLGADFVSIERYAVSTVDFWFGLRLWLNSEARLPDDYTTLSIIDTIAGGNVASTLNHETDSSGVVRGVFVKGGNAAGTGIVMDGSGIPGAIAFIEDSSITTAVGKVEAATAYLSDKSVAISGDLTWESATHGLSNPNSHWSAGTALLIDDVQVGVSSAVSYFISSISKTFLVGGKMIWRITYGTLPPSFARRVRRLTRAIRS